MKCNMTCVEDAPAAMLGKDATPGLWRRNTPSSLDASDVYMPCYP